MCDGEAELLTRIPRNHVNSQRMIPTLANHENHIALVGKGSGREIARYSNAHQIWGVNDVVLNKINVDLIFNMHDLNSDLAKKGWEKVQDTLDHTRERNIPVFTCFEVPDYPNTHAFPIEKIINYFLIDYFTSTIAYALAYAAYIGVERIDMFGINGMDNHKYQRTGLEYWIGVCMGQDIDVRVFGDFSSLLKTDYSPIAPVGKQWRYGYDPMDSHSSGLPPGARIGTV